MLEMQAETLMGLQATSPLLSLDFNEKLKGTKILVKCCYIKCCKI